MKLKLLLLSFLLSAVYSWGQVTLYSENFGSTAVLPTGWASSNTANGWSASTASVSSGYTGASGGTNMLFNSTGTNGVSHTLTYANNLSTVGYSNITVMWGARSTATFVSAVTFQWSSDGTTWNNVAFTNVAANTTWALVNGGVRISLPVGAEGVSNLRFRWTSTSTNSGNHRIDDFSVQGTLSGSPLLTASSLTSFGSQCNGGAYGPNSFTITGSSLSTADVSVGPLSGYTYSTTAGGTYSSALTLSQSGGSYSQAIYVKFNPIVAGSYNGNIPVSGGGASSINVAASGSGVAPVTPGITIAAVPSGAICAGTSVSFTATPFNLGGGTASYQWKVNGSNAGTGTTYTSTAFGNGDVVTCVLTVTGGCVTTATATSAGTIMTVNPIPADPTGSITVSANPSCGPASLSYAAGYYWQTSAAGTSTASPTSSNFTLNTTGTVYVRAYNGSCWSTGSINTGVVTINTAQSITAQPSNQFAVVGNTATFSVAAANAISYQWQVSTNGGATWSNVGANASSYTTPATTLLMSGYQYQVIVSGNAPCGTVTSTAATLTVSTGPCLTENFAVNALPTGWVQNSITFTANYAEFGTNNGDLTTISVANPASLTFTLARTSNTTAKDMIVEVSTTSQVAGFSMVTTYNHSNTTSGGTTNCTVDLSAYTASSSVYIRFRKSSSTTSPWRLDDINVYCSIPPSACTTPTAQPTVLNFSGITTTTFNGSFMAASPAPSRYLVVYSTNPTLVAGDLPVDGTNYSVGTALGDGTVAYAGTGTSFSLSGLTSGTTYYIFVFSYNSGVCATAYNTTSPLSGSVTTVATYCTSAGNTSYNTSVTNVTLNTINNTSAKPSGYSDYTAFSTNLQQGVSYPLSAKINTDGNYTVLAFAWIDFNHDLDFNDAGEAFDLGSATNVSNGLSSSSPLSITIPLTAVIGATRMRVIATYDGDSSACLTGFDGEVEDYTINIIAACVPTHTVTSFAPTSGPTGTDVTITGTGFTAGTTVMFNGISAVVTYVNATAIVATVPAGQTTGAITVTEAGCKVITTSDFTEIKQTGTCSTGNNLTDLIISETYDSVGGNSWYVELYNPTGSSIDLDALGANYKIVRYGDIGTTNGLRSIDISGVIPAGGIYLADLGSDSSCDPMTYNYVNKGNGINENDEIRLTKNDVTVDIVTCPNEKGYVIRRNAAAAGPSATYNAGDWTLLLTETCANLGLVPFSFTSNLPAVNTNPSDATTCGTTASFTISATPSGAGVLTYQWFYNNGVASGWTSVAAGSFGGVTASGFNSGSLTLNGSIVNLNGYQFYCQVTQDGTCSVASDAAQLKVNSTTWNGTSWSNGIPSLTKLAIIDGNYNTATNGDFECCSLIVNSPFMLDIKDTDYVVIQNDLTVNGILEVQNQGSLVMVSDTGVVTNNGTTTVRKMSTPFDLYDYTFWSSPVVGAPISVFSQWQANYIFKLNTAAFRDDNNDSHDDNMDAWVFTPQAEIMSPGRGYAAMGKINQTYPAQQGSVYNGAVNNGVITQAIALSLDNTKANDDFNLIGNPYPSAISADAFIAANPNISGTLYFWTHEGNIQVAAVNPGPMAMNFSPDDFAYYNLAGGTGTRAGMLSGNGNSNAPNGFIASGQGFQVDADAASSVTFNNSMRNKAHVNTNFYKTVSGAVEKDRLWLNLTNSEGIFSQQLIGFFPNATMGVDRGYDGYCVKSPTYAAFYSIIGGQPYKIQGRSAFDVNDRVPLGFRSAFEKTYSIAIADIEGVLRNQNVYIEDLQLHIIHDLKVSNYVFSTPAGEFNNRFVLRFTNATLGDTDFEAGSNSVLVYANEGINVTSSSEQIRDVFVYDVLGRLIAERKAVNNASVLLQNVRKTQGALLVKVVLDNGKTTTKKVLY